MNQTKTLEFFDLSVKFYAHMNVAHRIHSIDFGALNILTKQKRLFSNE